MSPMDDIVCGLANQCSADADIEAMTIAEVERLDVDELRQMACNWIATLVRVELRARTRRAERDASQPSRQSAGQSTDTATRRANLARFGVSTVVHGSVNRKTGGVALGCECEKCSDVRAEEDAHGLRFTLKIQGLLDDYKTSLHIEWTDELRRSTFVLRDGRRVEWGTASIEDHRERSAMFMANVAGNLEGAARHEHAIAALSTSGASCLDALVEAERVAA